MFSLFLTQSGGFLGTIAKPFGWILNLIYEFLTVFGIENVAIAIILFTLITKVLMLPLTIKQQKFTKMSSIMQPELAKIAAKYKGKKDEASMRKMQMEQSAVYEKYGANPTAGCLPLLISLPIMLALYRVIQNVPAYVPSVKALYATVADSIMNAPAYQSTYASVISDMAATAKVSVSGFSELANHTLTMNHMIDIFGHFSTSNWADLAAKFPDVATTINQTSKEIIHINSVVGSLNVANAPGWTFPGVIIPILSAASQWAQSKLMQANQSASDDPTAKAMNSSMTTVMPLMSGFMCTMLPLGLGIYWVASAVFGMIQQFFVNKYMDKVDVNEMVEKSRTKAAKKRSKVSGVTGAALKEFANTQTKSMEVEEMERAEKSTKNYAKLSSNKEVNTTKNQTSEVSSNTGSIADRANLLKGRYNDKGEK